jgi:hypothetical protein
MWWRRLGDSEAGNTPSVRRSGPAPPAAPDVDSADDRWLAEGAGLRKYVPNSGRFTVERVAKIVPRGEPNLSGLTFRASDWPL